MKSDDANPVDLYVGAEVRRRRREMQISQGDLGRSCGVTFQQLQKYENGQNRISASALFAIAGALNCAPGDLFPPRAIDMRKGGPLEELTFSKLNRTFGLMPEVELIADLTPTQRRALAVIVKSLVGLNEEKMPGS